MASWYDVFRTETGSLAEARLQAHHAAQVAAAPGATLLADKDDHSDRNLEWVARLGSLVGRPVGRLQAGLRVGDLSWVVVRDGDIVDAHQAHGYTVAQGLGWLRAAWRAAGGADTVFRVPGYDIPEHRVAHDGLFGDLPDAELHQLTAWLANADLVIRDIARAQGGEAVRVWPHHFDMASLIVLRGEGEDMTSIGVGFTPGDEWIAQPYFYVNPWPHPEPDDLPDLPVGDWHTGGSTGAVLTGADVDGEATVRRFIEAAIGVERRLLG